MLLSFDALVEVLHLALVGRRADPLFVFRLKGGSSEVLFFVVEISVLGRELAARVIQFLELQGNACVLSWASRAFSEFAS